MNCSEPRNRPATVAPAVTPRQRSDTVYRFATNSMLVVSAPSELTNS